MKRSSTIRASFLALCAIAFCGCHRVKPVVLLPQQPPATTHTEPSGNQSQPDTTTPADTQTQQPAANKPNDQATNTPPAKPEKTRPRHHPSTTQKNNPQPS